MEKWNDRDYKTKPMKRIIHTIITLAVSLASANAQISGEIKPNVSDVSVSKSAGYDVIKLSGANHVTNHVGMPELPVISKKINSR